MSEQTSQIEQQGNTNLPWLGGNDPFKGVVTLLISLTVVLIAVVSYLIGDIKEYATIAIRDVTQYSIQAMGEKANGELVISHAYADAYRAWAELNLLTVLARDQGNDDAARRYTEIRNDLVELNPLLEDPYFDPSGSEAPDVASYETATYLTESTALSERSDNAYVLAVAWVEQFFTYTTHLVLLATTLFLYALATTVEGRLRWFFVIIGAIITNVVGIWIIITALTPVTGLPDEAIDAYARGVGLAHQGDYQAAVSAFNEALDADASYANAYYRRGNAYYDQGLYEQAAADYQAALDAGKDDIGTLWNLGWTHYVLGNFEQAIESTQSALNLQPDQPALYFNLGLMQLASGDLEAAQATYQTGQEIIDQRVSGLRAQGSEPPSSLWWYMDTAALDLSRLTNCLEEQVCQEAPPYEALSALDDPQATAEHAQELRTHLKNLTVAMEYNEDLQDTPVVAQVGSFEFAEGVRDETGNVVAYAPLPVQGADLRFGRIFEGESELVNPTTVRPSVEGTQDLFLIFDYEEMQDQQPVVVKIYLDGKEVSGLRLVEEWSLGAEGEAVLPISPGSQFSLPPGNYWVELYVDNQLVQQGGFTITGP